MFLDNRKFLPYIGLLRDREFGTQSRSRTYYQVGRRQSFEFYALQRESVLTVGGVSQITDWIAG